jgi:hypothetical protein
MGRSGGSGNAAWRAAAVANQIKPGRGNRRKCIATARVTGEQCGNLAMRGVSTCRLHGGKGMLAIKRIREKRDARIKKTVTRAHKKLQREWERITQGRST